MLHMRIPLTRPEHPNHPFAILQTLQALGRSRTYTSGNYAQEFEQRTAEACDRVFAVAIPSGTVAAKAIFSHLRIQPGDEIIFSSYTRLSNVYAALSLGAIPVFADLSPVSIQLSIESIRLKLSSKTKVIFLTHTFGFPAQVNTFQEFAKQNQLFLVEDASFGLGSKYRGKATGSFGIAGILDFHPKKFFSKSGGGMILTDDETLATHARYTGNKTRAEYVNGDLPTHVTEFQAALGLWVVQHLHEAIVRRRFLANRYEEAFSEFKNIQIIPEEEDILRNYQCFPIRIRKERQAVITKALAQKGIQIEKGPAPAHLHPYVEARVRPARLPEMETLYQEIFLLPLYTRLSEQQQDEVIEALRTCS